VDDDFRLFNISAAQRFADPVIDSADPKSDLAVPAALYQNLLLNPGFESGTDNWLTNEDATTGNTMPFAGASYFQAGDIEEGFARQTVDLPAAGFTLSELDSRDLQVVFSGRIRSAAENAPDTGRIEITFLDGSDAVIDTVETVSDNPTDRWDLVGDRVQLPVGTRKIAYRFIADRTAGNSGYSNDSYLDHAFMGIVSENIAPNQGAYGNSGLETPETGTHLALRFPDLYTDWEQDKPHTIRWDSFGNSGNSPVKIELYQDSADGPARLLTIADMTADDGEYIWKPVDNNIDFGTHGLRIMVSLRDNPLVFDRSVEPFAVPEGGSVYYVDDYDNSGDEYTPDATGSNRNTGKTADAPKPNPVNLLRIYELGVGDTLNIDTGVYPLIDELRISGTTDLGLGLDEAFTMQGPTDTSRDALLVSAIPEARPEALVELNDADYLILYNLTMEGAQRGLWVHNGSNVFSASYITAHDHLQDSIRIETDSPGRNLDHLTAYDSGENGIYIKGEIGGLSNILSHDNAEYGIYLRDTGNALVRSSEIYGNRDGIYVHNNVNGTETVIGAADLSLSAGNIIHDNTRYGINAGSRTLAAGNTIYNHNGVNGAGITITGGRAENNIIYSSLYGIFGYGEISANNIYDITSQGIRYTGVSGTVSNNILYSCDTGIYLASPYNSSGVTVKNNIFHDNNKYGLVINGGPQGHQVVNNSFFEPLADAVVLQGSTVDVSLKNNIFQVDAGTAITVAADSQAGFFSDYNLFYNTGSGGIGSWQGDRTTLVSWQNAAFSDYNSIFADPLFVDPAGNDFHVRSLYGSFHGSSLAPELDPATSLRQRLARCRCRMEGA